MSGKIPRVLGTNISVSYKLPIQFLSLATVIRTNISNINHKKLKYFRAGIVKK